MYGVSHENWFVARKISQPALNKSEANFKKLADLEDDDKAAIATCLEESREYIQINFRTEEPSTHVNKLKLFWEKPNGPQILSTWFEWLVGGSDSGDLKSTIEENLDLNMIIVEKVLVEKNSEAFSTNLKAVKHSLIEKFGNKMMYYIHLMRALCKLWQNEAGKFLFIDGEDELQNISSQPYLHIVTVNETGEAGQHCKLLISVRVGGTVIFEDVTLGQGLAALIQVAFSFNLLYDKAVDDIFNFLQRILAKFGPADGARNEKNKLKKNFADFLCLLGKIVIESEKGKNGIISFI